jgi:flagellar FliL protein
MSKQEATPAPAPAPAPGADAAPAGPSKIAALLPVILVVVLAPVVSWAVAQFVILPQFEKKLNAVVATAAEHGAATEAHGAPAAAEGHAAPAAEGEKGGHGGKKGEAAGPSNSYEFTNIVVNLAGTMGTRYLKTTFLVTGKDANLREYFNRDKAKMVDVTLNVLSSLSLADLEEAGAKNIIREKLVNAYNQAIGKKVAEQVYFSDFVVQ